MNKPAAVLFDMDGVLVDSVDFWYHALREIFDRYLQRELDKEEFVEKYWGRETREIFSEMGIDLEIGPFCEKICSTRGESIRVFPHTKACLESLSSYRKAVITNAPALCARRILTAAGLEGYFEAIVTSDQVKRSKPDPAIIFEACRILNVEPTKTWLVGDHGLDMQAGRAAGCTVVGIGVEGDYTLDSLGELADIVETTEAG